MKQKLLLFTLLSLFLGKSTWARDKYEIQFTYDTAGNQTLRDRVCINCGSSKQAEDTTAVVEVDLAKDISQNRFGEKEIEDGQVMAYPNPVSGILNVEWVGLEKRVSHILLFSGEGRQLYRRDIRSNQGSLDLNMGNYPVGMFILYIQYPNNPSSCPIFRQPRHFF